MAKEDLKVEKIEKQKIELSSQDLDMIKLRDNLLRTKSFEIKLLKREYQLLISELYDKYSLSKDKVFKLEGGFLVEE